MNEGGHRVPLSSRDGDHCQDGSIGHDGLYFSDPKPDTAPSSLAMAMLLQGIRVGVTVHTFRSAFGDRASKATGFPHDVCEMALAHTIAEKAEAPYRRRDLFDKRPKLMEAWGVDCASAKAEKVVPLRTGAAA